MAPQNFYEWLVKQKNQRTPIGQFAREATSNPAFPKDVPTTLESVLECIRASPNSSPQALAIARTAFRTYSRN